LLGAVEFWRLCVFALDVLASPASPNTLASVDKVLADIIKDDAARLTDPPQQYTPHAACIPQAK
jgi:hypothetical protein